MFETFFWSVPELFSTYFFFFVVNLGAPLLIDKLSINKYSR